MAYVIAEPRKGVSDHPQPPRIGGLGGASPPRTQRGTISLCGLRVARTDATDAATP